MEDGIETLAVANSLRCGIRERFCLRALLRKAIVKQRRRGKAPVEQVPSQCAGAPYLVGLAQLEERRAHAVAFDASGADLKFARGRPRLDRSPIQGQGRVGRRLIARGAGFPRIRIGSAAGQNCRKKQNYGNDSAMDELHR